MSDWGSDFKVSFDKEEGLAPKLNVQPDGRFSLSIPLWLIGSLVMGAFVGWNPFDSHPAHRGNWADALLWAGFTAGLAFLLRWWRGPRRRSDHESEEF